MSLLAWLGVVLLLILLAGTVYQALGASRDARRLGTPGRMVDIGIGRLHLYGSGEGAPAVILEAGIAASSLSWAHVQPEVARFTRVYSYDRAGLGWSEPSSRPRTCANSAEELSLLLERAGIPPPYIFAAHSFGACVVRLYAAKFPEKVAGMVFVDGLSPKEWLHPNAERRRMLKGGWLFSQLGAFLARVGVTRFCLLLLQRGRTWFPRLFVRSMGSGVSTVAGRILGEIRKLPVELWPTVAALWCLPKCYKSMASHVLHLPQSSAEAAAVTTLGDLPLIVLTKNNVSEIERTYQEELARLSSRGKQIYATQSGHWIHLDQPELVVQAIRELVDEWRRGRASSATPALPL
jgi:pimeloyl-ACP methyl ester carboxylesterase